MRTHTFGGARLRVAGLSLTIIGAAVAAGVTGGSAATASTSPHAKDPVTCNGKAATILGTDGADVLRGTPGDDVIVGLRGPDVLIGGGGDDLLCGGVGEDRLQGGPGNDQLYGQRDFPDYDHGVYMMGDFLDGGVGDDLLSGGWDPQWTDPYLDIGGGRNDRIIYSRYSSGIDADLAAGVVDGADSGHDTIVRERRLDITGTNFADHLVGDVGSNWIVGLDGADTIETGSGPDYAYPGRHSPDTRPDTVDLGYGDDTAYLVDAGTRVHGGPGMDYIDARVGHGGGVFVWAGPGSDGMIGSGYDDFLDGGPGNDGADGRDGQDRCPSVEDADSCESP